MDKYVFTLNNKTYTFNKDDDSDKYVVFTCAKNEERYIEEFVKHYLRIGFDKIIIADNNDDQNILSGILKEQIENKQVQIFDCCGFKGFQCEIYTMFLNESNYKWCAYFDVDEFLEITGNFKDIKEMLEEHDEDCFCVHWMIYGSNGIKDVIDGDYSVQERFKKPVYPIGSFKENMFIKSIVRNTFKNGRFESSHIPVPNDGFNYIYKIGEVYQGFEDKQVFFPIHYKECYLKHYYSKSFEEFSQKVERGWPDGNDIEILRNYRHYFYIDSNGEPLINKAKECLFTTYKNAGKFDSDIKEYDVIVMSAPTNNYYSLLKSASNLMSRCENKTFLVDRTIPNEIFNMILEFAIETNNKLVSINITQEECEKAFYDNHKEGVYNYFNIRAF